MKDDATRIPWLSRWDFLPLAAALALALALPTLYRGLPDPIPTHFDARGVANGWTSKASFPWFVFGLPAGLWLLLLLLGRAFVGSNQDPEGRKSLAMAPLRGLVCLGVLWLMGGTLLLPRYGTNLLPAMVVGFVLCLVAGIGLMIKAMKTVQPDRSLDEHYRWGLFYVNPDDPEIWVPKPQGLGWTLNFAHGMSWFMLGLLLLPAALIIGLTCLR